MFRKLTIVAALLASVGFVASVKAGSFNGAADNEIDSLGYYYAMTGGKFPTGTVPNGDNGSGGTFRYILDDPGWGSYPLGQWNKDDWFSTNASLALTLKNSGAIVYDNNGLEDGSYGSYYNGTGVASSASVPGLYRGYSMSNNFDWIYAGYFKLTQATTIDQIIGYYDENSGFDSDSPSIRYDMNIWSAYQDNPTGNPNSYMPTVASFTGDVFSAKSAAGAFSWAYTGVDRIFGDDAANKHDEIWKLTYTLNTPITLPAGEYFFSHDAEIAVVPLPAAAWMGIALFGSVTSAGWLRSRRQRALID
jgi:hypothetical protein